MRLIDKTLIAFSNDVDSDLPAPGGGSVAAYVSNLGVALARMMGHLTISKKKFLALEASEQEVFLSTFNKLSSSYDNLLKMVDEDTLAFNEIMAAYKLPKETAEQQQIRSETIQKATIKATKVPFEAAKEAYHALLVVPVLIKNGNTNAISDLGSAIYLLEAGMNCSILNVKINAGGLKDREMAASFLEICQNMELSARKIVTDCLLEINKLL
ncbi:MAG: cyclodeaminase/cyclohydrolase family protein [Bacilli bacterium]|jgi:formiminotetrahydrofolate cyclodeaminase|nr:cyclodeaminase/cyclohydrolase family protein [Bacilli bacterium]